MKPIELQSMQSLSKAKRRSRAKRCLAWEDYELATNGIYAKRIACIAHKFPMLTPNQLRVAALTTAMQPSWKIAEILGSSELAVNKVRCRIRKSLGISKQISLTSFLISLTDENNDSQPQMGI